MLLSSRSLYRCIHLSRNTQICKSIETCIPACIIIPHSFEKSYHSFLNQIVFVSPQNIHGFRLFPDQILVLIHNIIRDLLLSLSETIYQFLIRTVLVILVHVNPHFCAVNLINSISDGRFHKLIHLLLPKHSGNQYLPS